MSVASAKAVRSTLRDEKRQLLANVQFAQIDLGVSLHWCGVQAWRVGDVERLLHVCIRVIRSVLDALAWQQLWLALQCTGVGVKEAGDIRFLLKRDVFLWFKLMAL